MKTNERNTLKAISTVICIALVGLLGASALSTELSEIIKL